MINLLCTFNTAPTTPRQCAKYRICSRTATSLRMRSRSLLLSIRYQAGVDGEDQECQKSALLPKGQDLNSFLLKPVQRICKYNLLIKVLGSCRGHSATPSGLKSILVGNSQVYTALHARLCRPQRSHREAEHDPQSGQ